MAQSLLESLYKDLFVLTGRNALGYYGICSTDVNVVCLESNELSEKIDNSDLGHVIFMKESEEEDIITLPDGTRYSSVNKALADLLRFPYDDSAVDDAFDSMNKEELESFKDYLEKNRLFDLKEEYCDYLERGK